MELKYQIKIKLIPKEVETEVLRCHFPGAEPGAGAWTPASWSTGFSGPSKADLYARAASLQV